MIESQKGINSGKVYTSFFWKVLERLLSQGINLIVQVVLARLLLPSDFGSLAIIVAITNYAAIFVQSGIGTVIIQKKNIDKKDLSTIFTISLGTAFIFYISLFISAPLIANYYGILILKPALRVLALVLFLNAINAVQTAVLSKKMKFKQLFLRTAIAVPVAGIVGISMAYWGFGIWALIFHNLVNMMTVVIFMSFDKDVKAIRLGFYKDRIRGLYSFSIKVLFSSLVSGMHDMLRTMIIGKKYSSNDLAYYDKAYTYSYYAVSIVNSSISTVLLPAFSKSQDDTARLKEMSRKSVRMSAFIMIPAMIGIASIARPLTLTILTSKWEQCVPFLILFCILRIPTFIMTIDKQVYYAMGRSEINLYYEIALCLLNILTLFITTQLGIIYVAVGATLVEYIGCIAICVIASKIYKYTLKERVADIYKPILSSLIMAVVIFIISKINCGSSLITLFAQILLGIISYALSSCVLKDMNIVEIKNIVESILHKKCKEEKND